MVSSYPLGELLVPLATLPPEWLPFVLACPWPLVIELGLTKRAGDDDEEVVDVLIWLELDEFVLWLLFMWWLFVWWLFIVAVAVVVIVAFELTLFPVAWWGVVTWWPPLEFNILSSRIRSNIANYFVFVLGSLLTLTHTRSKLHTHTHTRYLHGQIKKNLSDFFFLLLLLVQLN